ncbi:MAG TPA: hypothetical protein VGP44_11985 [Gemmatimonadales bacterium]|nr:hypothetical protein [Gemmatimonadales bacterium]
MAAQATMKPTQPTAATPLTARERLRELDRNGEFPLSWRPDPGDEVKGEILRYSETELALSGPCQIAVLGQEDGEPISVFLMGTVLQGEFEKKNPKVGETVLIRYVGKHEKGYKKFVVHVEREEEEIKDFHQAAGIKKAAQLAPEEIDPDDPFADDDAATTPYASKTLR